MKSRTVENTRIISLFLAASYYSAATLAFDCLIEPLQVVTLSTPAFGIIEKLHVRRSDHVHNGQIIATLRSSVEKAALEIARHKAEQRGHINIAEQKINFAKRKYDRRSALAQERLIPPQEIDDAEAELRLAEADLILANESKSLAEHEYRQQLASLDLRTVTSPLDGIVIDQMAYPGEVVDSTNTKKGIVKVAQLNPIQIRAVLPKTLFGKIRAGQTAKITPEIAIKGPLIARITTVDRVIDAASGTFIVLMELDNPKFDVPAGIRCTANIEPKG